MGPRDGLDGRKISSPPGFDSRIVQPVVSHYTDWAIAAHDMNIKIYKLKIISETIYRVCKLPKNLCRCTRDGGKKN